MSIDTELHEQNQTHEQKFEREPDKYFKSKNKMEDSNFSRSVKLKPGAKDFLEDTSWKDDFINGRRNVE